MSRRNELIYKLVLTAIFSALCFSLTFVAIPLPTGAKVHLGNFACVLAGLLLGPIVGGVSGSLGMGLNDIAAGYGWDTIVRTFIVKFILGFAVGFLFQIFIKRQKASKRTLYSLTALFFVGAVVSLISYINGDPFYDNAGNLDYSKKLYIIELFGQSKVIELSILVPIFIGIFFGILFMVILFLFFITQRNKEKESLYLSVSTVTSISVLVNTVAEFLLRWLLKGIALGSSEIALLDSVSKLPSNLITGVATIVFVTLVYFPLYQALHHAGFDKYIIHPENEIEDEEE